MGTMSPLCQNITALLDLPLVDQGIAHITTETSGNVYSTGICRSLNTLVQPPLGWSTCVTPIL